MPDYKRLVSYMYTYEEGKKRNNVGYARVEARNGQCKFTIHVSALSYNEKQVTVYAFKRNKNGIEGIQLGKLNFRNEVGDFRLVTDPSRILNTEYGIDDIGGIVLYHTDTKYLATVWDENPLTLGMVQSLEFKETTVLSHEVINNEKNEDRKTENVVDARDNKVIERIIDNADNNVVENIDRKTDNIVDNITENTNQFVDSMVTEDNIQDSKENSLKDVTQVAESSDENVHDLSRRENTQYYNNSQNTVKDIINRNPSSNGYGNFSTSMLEESPIASKLYKEYPRMYPFDDNEITWCVRIEPKDIEILPVDVWPLANNSFLLHGFYGHRHLIFAKVNNRNSNSYIIGVPGIYHNRERFMAKMFGFENFKCAKKRDRREGEFGYWYVPVNLK